GDHQPAPQGNTDRAHGPRHARRASSRWSVVDRADAEPFRAASARAGRVALVGDGGRATQGGRMNDRRPLCWLGGVSIAGTRADAVLVGCGGGDPGKGTPPDTTSVKPPPPPDTSTAGMELGAKVYAARCTLCHGPQGHGDGPAAAAMNPKPRDHTDGSYMR